MRASTVPVRYDPMPAFRYAHAQDGRPMHESGNANCDLCSGHGCYSYYTFSRQVGFDGAAMNQWLKRGGMTEETAEKVAKALGHHPSAFWPEWWTNLEILEEADRRRPARRRRYDHEFV